MEVPQAPRLPADRLDTVLNYVVLLLVAAVLGLGGWFGWTIYQTQRQERLSTPAGRALDELERQVRAAPNDVVLRVRLGEAYASSALYDKALNSFDQALKLDKEHTGAYLDIGLVYMAQSERGKAEKAFQKVVELTAGTEYEALNARREQAFFYLGQIAVDDGRYEDAIGLLKEALRMRRDASDSYYFLARAYRGLDEQDAAFESLEIALAFDPNYGAARYELGQYYMDASNEASAAVEFRRVADTNPDSEIPIEALSALGTVESRMKAAEEAKADGDLTKAIEQAYVAVAIEPLHIPALLLRASLFEQAARTADALSDYEAVLDIDEGNATAVKARERLAPAGQ